MEEIQVLIYMYSMARWIKKNKKTDRTDQFSFKEPKELLQKCTKLICLKKRRSRYITELVLLGIGKKKLRLFKWDKIVLDGLPVEIPFLRIVIVLRHTARLQSYEAARAVLVRWKCVRNFNRLHGIRRRVVHLFQRIGAV